MTLPELIKIHINSKMQFRYIRKERKGEGEGRGGGERREGVKTNDSK